MALGMESRAFRICVEKDFLGYGMKHAKSRSILDSAQLI